MHLKCPKIMFFVLLLFCNLLYLGLNNSFAQQIPQYESKLMRLAEILGSLHYLKNLCGQNSNIWRDNMNALIDAETTNPVRRARLYAAFNDAYRAFSTNYYECTQAALNADQKYMQEGAAISEELLKRYGN